MATANARLIDAMLRTADSIEMGTATYNWGSPSSCNCGLLSRCLLNQPARFEKTIWAEWKHLHQIVPEAGLDSAFWTSLTSKAAFCLSSGIPITKIVQLLLNTGLEVRDIRELEYLSNKTILRKARIRNLPSIERYQNPQNVVKYLRTWAALLQSELDAAAPAEARELVTA